MTDSEAAQGGAYVLHDSQAIPPGIAALIGPFKADWELGERIAELLNEDDLAKREAKG